MAHTAVASQMRYRSGVVQFVVLKTNPSYPIQEGDLIYSDGTYALPASALADQGTLVANQLAFAAAFVGVACSKDGLQTGETSFKLTTSKGYVLVATTGDFAFPCAATSWATGDKVGAVEISTNDGLEDQKVAKVTLSQYAIGIAKVPYNAIGTSQTEIVVAIRSALMDQEVNSGA